MVESCLRPEGLCICLGKPSCCRDTRYPLEGAELIKPEKQYKAPSSGLGGGGTAPKKQNLQQAKVQLWSKVTGRTKTHLTKTLVVQTRVGLLQNYRSGRLKLRTSWKAFRTSNGHSGKKMDCVLCPQVRDVFILQPNFPPMMWHRTFSSKKLWPGGGENVGAP